MVWIYILEFRKILYGSKVIYVGIVELRGDLSALYLKAGLKKLSTVLVVTDAQLVDETLLGPIHDFLAAGEIPGLFSDEEIDNIVSAVRNEVIFIIDSLI